jgi:hypothetical protein
MRSTTLGLALLLIGSADTNSNLVHAEVPTAIEWKTDSTTATECVPFPNGSTSYFSVQYKITARQYTELTVTCQNTVVTGRCPSKIMPWIQDRNQFTRQDLPDHSGWRGIVQGADTVTLYGFCLTFTDE